MLFWPSVTALGFLVLAALVVALGRSSTERYEFERNRVQGQAAAVPTRVSSSTGHPGGGQPHAAPASGTAPTPEAPLEQRSAVGVATHPAGKRMVPSGEDAAAWWLVEESPDRGEQVVGGPFPDRLEADWAAVAGGRGGSRRAVFGVQRAGRVVRRPLPAERAWLGELGDQLDRLPPVWDELLPDDEEDALVTLVVEVTAALVEAGLALHDCAGGAPAGGVCLSPEPGRRGVLVGWHQHDRMSVEQVRGAETDAAVQQTLNSAVSECLRSMGFRVERFGSTGCSVVVAAEY